MSEQVNFTQDAIWAVESPLEVIEGSTITIQCVYWDTPTLPDATVYKNRADVTSTAMPSGSHSNSGDIVTLKPLTALVGGNRYIIDVEATVGGNIYLKKIMVKAGRATDEQ